MIQIRFPAAATLILLTACQSDQPNTAQSSPAQAPPEKTAHSVPAAPVMPVGGFAGDSHGLTVKITDKSSEAPPVAAEPDTSPAGRLATVKKEYDDAQEAYFKLFDGAKTDAEYEAIAKTAKRPDLEPFRARARAIVDEDPASPVALDAITWLLTSARGGHDQAELLAIVEKHHMQSDKLTPLTRALAGDTKDGGQAFVQKVMEASPSADVRGTAMYSLATAMQRDIDSAKRVQSAKDEDADKMSKRYGEERLAALKAFDVSAAQKKMEAMLERTLKEYPGVAYGKSTLGERAAADLYEMRNLIVGKVAPDIEGEDLDGANFHLADYRGKIVLLDFWGNW